MKKIKLISRLLMAALAVCVLCISCETEGEDVYSVETFSITFESNGGGLVSEVETNADGTINQPTSPELKGYAFDGWYLDSDLTMPFDFESTVTSDFTLYAKWSLIDYTVSFYTYYADVTNSYESISANIGDKVSRPEADPIRTGYTFDDWYGSSDFDEAWDFDKDVVGDEDLTIYANWTLNGYGLEFVTYCDDVIEPYVDVEYGSTVAEPTAPVRYGYNFVGWYDNVDYSGFEWDFDLNVVGSEGVTLYAKWDNETYTVTFDLQTGSIYETQSIEYLSSVSKPEVDPASSTAVFIEWCEDAEGTTPYDFASPIEADITLYANWEVPDVIVQFWSNPEGYSTLPEEAYYTSLSMEAVTLTDVEDPRLDGFRFMGWYASLTFDESTKVEDVSAVTFDAAQTNLYAKYVDEFTVTFDLGGGSVDGLETTQYFLTDETVGYPGEASRSGYRFDGWFLNDSDDKVDFSTPIRENFTITAKWTQVFSVGFNFNNGELSGYDGVTGFYTDSIEIGTILADPGVPTRYGFDFLGWYDGSYGAGNKYDFEEGTSATVTLTARWRWNISSEDIFQMFRDAINDGSASAENIADAVLTADITLTEENWTPISSASANAYAGTFDGQEYSIYGLKMTPASICQGLFAYVYNGNIKNLKIVNPDIASTTNYVGSLAGAVSGAAVLSNIQVVGGSVSANATVGGLVGYYYGGGTIENCHNYGTQVNKTGASASNAGGLVGLAANANTKIINCSNSGFVNCAGGTQNGGIVGYASNAITIAACSNSGTVYVPSANANGGILGTSVASVKIIACCNRGHVSGGSNVGGIVGQNGGAIYVVSCYNTGTATSNTSTTGNIGPIIGNKNASTSVMACYYLPGALLSGNGTAGIEASASVLNSSTVVGIMNGSLAGSYEIDYKYEVSTVAGYPILVEN